MSEKAVRRPFSATKLLMISFLCLFVSHLSIKTFVPSLAINAIGIALVVVILAWVLFGRRDVFGFLMIILFCSQFRIGTNQAGLFNLVSFILLFAYMASHKVREMPDRPDLPVAFALALLLVFNTLGLVLRSPMPIHIQGLQFAAFGAILMAFYVASNLRMTDERIKTFATMLGFMVFYDLLVSLNQHYAAIKVPTPLLGLNEDLFYAATNAFGSFGSASMNGTFNMMVLTVLVPLLCSSVARTRIALNPVFFGLTLFVSAVLLVLANMRAAAVGTGMVIAVYMLMFSTLYRRSFRYSKYLTRFIVVLLAFLAFFGAAVGLQNIQQDFAEVDFKSEKVLSGEALNRLGPWQAGLDNLIERSWYLGYGHGVSESNRLAWGGTRIANGSVIGGGHLHNLYLALPTLYGWVGAVAYVTILLMVVLRLYRVVRRHGFNQLPVVLALGLLMSTGLFILDEIKSGNAVHYFNFPMIFFIWLGFGLATVRTVRADIRDARQNHALVQPA